MFVNTVLGHLPWIASCAHNTTVQLLTHIPHIRRSSRRSHPDSSLRHGGFVECYSAQQVSIPFWHRPCQGIPDRPACCWQSTLQAWWAATGGQDGACCRGTRATPALGVAVTGASQREMHGHRWQLELPTPSMASAGPDQASLSLSDCDWCSTESTQVTIRSGYLICNMG